MTTALQTPLRLTLQPGDVLPDSLSWRIQDGYIRTSAWDVEGESIVLGIWGPGDWVTAAYSAIKPIEIQCISTVVVEQFQPSHQDISGLLQRQIQNLEEIFLMNRIKLAEERLLTLLAWISRRFGQVNTLGYRLSLKDMNLTHKALGDISGLTRVTVTKTLNRFKASGVLQQVSKDDLLVPLAAVQA
ncbi:MAG: Crp/Fnr family transcriptional regulator [Synechococcaceae bacterium WB9_2_112]|nr:Crp/Fnr family transcriptional regulator [Synechococcaceae bacterium WB9_2_112]